MKRNRLPLDVYDMPDDMVAYIAHYGRHFNKKMYEFAVKGMYRKDSSRIQTMDKQEFENKLKAYGIVLENDILYDGMFVLAMGMADFYNSSIVDEKHLYMYVKDVVDDVDQVDGFIFNRFYADCVLKGEPIDWGDML